MTSFLGFINIGKFEGDPKTAMFGDDLKTAMYDITHGGHVNIFV